MNLKRITLINIPTVIWVGLEPTTCKLKTLAALPTELPNLKQDKLLHRKFLNLDNPMLTFL